METAPKRFALNLGFALLVVWFAILLLGGGASRDDVLGQVVTRGAAWIIAIALLFSSAWRLNSGRPTLIFLIAAISVVAIQLVPLPPAIWIELPGRNLLAEAAIASGQEQPWRPLSMSPGATVNSLSSLIVPVVTFMLVARLTLAEQWRLLGLVLGLVIASSLIALVQFSGAPFDNPLVNYSRGTVSAFFANRNHFALFAAIGCLLAPIWSFREREPIRWKALAMVPILILFVLVILASGSRAGLILGVIGVSIGVAAVYRRILGGLKRIPKAVSIGLVALSGTAVAATLLLSVTLDRAVSIDRVLNLDAGQDFRGEFIPTVIEMAAKYFPYGTGMGTFDPIYRINEPIGTLSTSYVNHAHNDFLEIVLEAGILGLVLMLSAIAWWLLRSIQAWRTTDDPNSILSRAGSGVLLLVLVASLPDYPARTPMIMAVMVVAAIWLNVKPRGGRTSPSEKFQTG